MAFPFVFESTFEGGTVAEWSSEQDTNGVLNVRHAHWLARHGARLEVPYRGAYCLHIDLTGRDTTQYVQEDDAFDLAFTETLSVRFLLYVQDLVMAATNRFTLFALQSAGPTDQVVIDLRNNSGVIELLAAQTGSAATVRATPLVQGVWHTVELTAVIDNDVNNDGTINFYVDGAQVGSQLGSLDQAAIVQARLGAMGLDAGTTAGHLLFDQVVADDTRVYPFQWRHAHTVTLTKSGHVALGPGQINTVSLLPGNGTDGVMRGWDTHLGATTGQSPLFELLAPVANTPVRLSNEFFEDAGRFQHGLYIELSGTTPRAMVTLDLAQGLSAEGVKQALLGRKAA